jgi:uncharacterized damage-inducible protein DinB
MPIKDALLPEFDQEMANTRRMLERVPLEKAAWKPHTKSYTLGALTTHVTHLPTWTSETLQKDKVDLGGGYHPPKQAESTAELLATFDGNVAAARTALAAAGDDVMMQPWSLVNGEQVYFTMPKAAVLRSFVFSHVIHHRAQLGVYLRLLDVPVPGMYGPSADDPGM